jgi:hypothetical protein
MFIRIFIFSLIWNFEPFSYFGIVRERRKRIFPMIGIFCGILSWKPTIQDLLTNRKGIKFYDCFGKGLGVIQRQPHFPKHISTILFDLVNNIKIISLSFGVCRKINKKISIQK